MNIKIYILNKIITWLLGGDLFNQIKKLVDFYMDKDLSGEEKRKLVFTRLPLIATSTAKVFLNLGIEAAVLISKLRVNTSSKS